MEAQLSEARGEFEKAIKQATAAISCDPNNPISFINRSYYHEQ